MKFLSQREERKNVCMRLKKEEGQNSLGSREITPFSSLSLTQPALLVLTF